MVSLAITTELIFSGDIILDQDEAKVWNHAVGPSELPWKQPEKKTRGLVISPCCVMTFLPNCSAMTQISILKVSFYLISPGHGDEGWVFILICALSPEPQPPVNNNINE